MKIDLHVHSRDGSDGRLSTEEIFAEASRREIDVMAITDHDSIKVQKKAISLAEQYGIRYLTGVELNVTFAHPDYRKGKPTALDFLGYNIDVDDQPLCSKLNELAEYREKRALKILENLNRELRQEGISELTEADMAAIQSTVDGSMGRPHIANYLIKKGIVDTKQQAFDRYLVRCDVPKLPLSLAEASDLVHGAGGQLILAHANDPNGTSLASFTTVLGEQQEIIRSSMLDAIDGIECWHSRHYRDTSESYLEFAGKHELLVTGGSDCHQQPILLGSVQVPELVMQQPGFA
jgi:predicted metal-dependent phosphoesterase TrpH